MKKANINWTGKQVSKMVEKGSITFDNAVQRGDVWDDDRKSLLIHSLIYGYPVPPFYALRSDDGKKYDMLDGKQRFTAVPEYVGNNFKLSNVPETAMGDGEEKEFIDIEGKTFSELPEEFQDAILSYNFTIYYFEDITDDEISEMFFRLNNGKPLTPVELTRVKAKSRTKIQELAQHEIFKSALTEKAMQRYKHEDIVMGAFAILGMTNVSLETKALRPYIIETEMTDEQQNNINSALTRIFEVHTILNESIETMPTDMVKLTTKIAKRLLTKTHLISIIPTVLKSIQDNVSVNDFASWARYFFSGKKSATIDEKYNSHAGTKTGTTESIKARLEAISASYENRKDTPLLKFDEAGFRTFCKDNRGKMIKDTTCQYDVAFEDFEECEQQALFMANGNGGTQLYNALIKKKYEQLEKQGVKANKRESA